MKIRLKLKQPHEQEYSVAEFVAEQIFYDDEEVSNTADMIGRIVETLLERGLISATEFSYLVGVKRESIEFIDTDDVPIRPTTGGARVFTTSTPRDKPGFVKSYFDTVSDVEESGPPYSPIFLISKERQRQKTEEGVTDEDDDRYIQAQLARAAAGYAIPSAYRIGLWSNIWPWASTLFKPTPNDRIRELVKAGALIVAEIERIQRERARLGKVETPPSVLVITNAEWGLIRKAFNIFDTKPPEWSDSEWSAFRRKFGLL